MTSFWQTLPKPLIGLSPMDGVTDYPYRYIHKKYGQPALIYTEFTSVEGICHKAERLLRDFMYDETQRPIIAQIYGTTPDYFRQTAVLLCELGFDGIDLNMGCPAKNVAHSGAGASLIKTPQLAQEIIKETKAGVQDWLSGKTARDCSDISGKIATEIEKRHKLLPEAYKQKRHIPVSVKTRVGFDKKVTKEWISTLLEMRPEAIALHGRTLKQAYGGEADWEEIGVAVKIAHEFAEKNSLPRTFILGNGDVKSYEQAMEKVEKYGVDGVLIGRASFGNPFIYKPTLYFKLPNYQITSLPIYQVALEHAKLYEKIYSYDEHYNFLPMRKHLGWYVKGLERAKEIRYKLFQTNSSHEVEEIFREYKLI